MRRVRAGVLCEGGGLLREEGRPVEGGGRGLPWPGAGRRAAACLASCRAEGRPVAARARRLGDGDSFEQLGHGAALALAMSGGYRARARASAHVLGTRRAARAELLRGPAR